MSGKGTILSCLAGLNLDTQCTDFIAHFFTFYANYWGGGQAGPPYLDIGAPGPPCSYSTVRDVPISPTKLKIQIRPSKILGILGGAKAPLAPLLLPSMCNKIMILAYE